jgi:chemotaxis protein histidine kinase CheA
MAEAAYTGGMPTARPVSSRLSAIAFSVLLAQAGAAWAQAPVAAPDAEALKRLATDDAQVQASRWGALATMAGKPWMALSPGDIATVWRMATWVVPGASMRFQRGFCAAAACQASDYVVQYNDKARQLEFFEDGAMAYTGHVEGDGSLRLKGTGLLGVLTAETLRHDAATGTMYANAHELKAGTAQQLTSATRGFPQAAAALAQAPAPAAAAATAAASAPSSDADLRAELAAMKAKVDQLSRQIEQTPPAPARPLSPAEARAKAAEEKRIADAKAREEAQRQAAERRAKAEEEKRQQAEARARAAEAKAAEARRLAQEKRAQQEAARREAEERRAQQEAAKREAEAAKLRAAEEAKARAAEEVKARAAQAARPPAAPVPSAALPVARAPEGPVRPGIFSTGTGYDVDVSVDGDTLVLKELAYNRISHYRPISPGSRIYGYRNPNTGTHFALTVESSTRIVASRFSPSGEVLPNGTPLTHTGGGQAQPVSGDSFKQLNDVAQEYLRKAQADPDNAQAWSFCGMAAMARAHGQNDVQVRQAAQALRSISTTDVNPCPRAIPSEAWSGVR